jgi:hypothetical protein
VGVILQCVTDFKDCFGLDESQVRLYTAIARHTVLVMAAPAICAVTAALLRCRTGTQAAAPATLGQPPPADPGMIPLTVPEIRRLLAALLVRRVALSVWAGRGRRKVREKSGLQAGSTAGKRT